MSASCFSDAADKLQRDGFAVARGVVDGSVLRNLVDKYEQEYLPLKVDADVRREKHGPEGKDGRGRIVHVSNVCEMPELASLAATTSLLRLASACLGCERVRPVMNTELFDKPPCGNASTQTPPHQDNFYFQSPLPGVALWIALDEMGDDAGTVRFVEGSHRRGLRFHDWDWGPYGGFAKQIFDYSDEDDELERQLGHLAPGDVAIHHGLTVHHAPPNLTTTRRRGLVLNYVAEHVANSLADDLYQPALEFRLSETGLLTAPLPPHWPERQALAKVCVECALVECRARHGNLVKTTVGIDRGVGTLEVRVDDSASMPEVAALVESGHVVHGMPHSIAPQSCMEPLPRHCVGAWSRTTDEPSDLAIRIQASDGVFVEMFTCSKLAPVSEDYTGDERQRILLDWAASQSVTAGQAELVSRHDAAAHGDNASALLAIRRRFGSHPPSGGLGVLRRIRSPTTMDTQMLSEVPLHGGQASPEEMWQRLRSCADATVSEGTATLKLVEDPEARQGLWVIADGWFGIVIGRPSADPLASAACRSLQHALRAFAERWGIQAEDALRGCEAVFGRIEAAGMFRATATFRLPSDQAGDRRIMPGDLVLDLGDRQLRRDAADGGVLVEAWSGRRWLARELPNNFVALGSLKRSMPH
eukprot:CAMPEP_0170215304 /NCGR_PEP_ID=MMETSP0116_2-20130129/7288_1 /TAXON_ID=400756 /ORGANISM="Durinskia baltica, Strain CSIRO CS-38" /LENGTH=644 /DNA_ID=CAMNT_0010465879 /DNA_START=54 /DNA_END=1989 /DNA_ORIENTATION=-